PSGRAPSTASELSSGSTASTIVRATRNAATTAGTMLRRNEPAIASTIVIAAIAGITTPNLVAPAEERRSAAVNAAAPPIAPARDANSVSAMIVNTTVT